MSVIKLAACPVHNYWRIFQVLISWGRGCLVAGSDHRLIEKRKDLFVMLYLMGP